MNSKIYQWFLTVCAISQGQIIPRWLRIVRGILMPISTLRWWLIRTEGYQIHTNTWVIHGVRYTDDYFKHMSKPDGRWFRVVKLEDGFLTIEQAPRLKVYDLTDIKSIDRVSLRSVD